MIEESLFSAIVKSPVKPFTVFAPLTPTTAPSPSNAKLTFFVLATEIGSSAPLNVNDLTALDTLFAVKVAFAIPLTALTALPLSPNSTESSPVTVYFSELPKANLPAVSVMTAVAPPAFVIATSLLALPTFANVKPSPPIIATLSSFVIDNLFSLADSEMKVKPFNAPEIVPASSFATLANVEFSSSANTTSLSPATV